MDVLGAEFSGSEFSRWNSFPLFTVGLERLASVCSDAVAVAAPVTRRALVAIRAESLEEKLDVRLIISF